MRRLRNSGKSESEAVQLAETVDRDRAAFIKQYFGVDWPERHRFHLMMNSTIGAETVVETILNGIDMFDKRLAQSQEQAQQHAAQ